MPDQRSAADEHALIQEITGPLATLPDDAMPIAADVDFPVVLRGYDRLAVDAYVKRTTQLVAELQATRSPEAAVRRALERVGEQISGILQRAHDTAEQITTQSRREAEERLEVARREATEIMADGSQRVKDLDVDTDRIWAERLRIVDDVRELAGQLLNLADTAAERFPPADTDSVEPVAAPGAAEPSEAESGDEEPTVTDPQAGAFDREPTQGDEESKEFDPDATAVIPPYQPRRDAPGGDDAPPRP